jgi:hypothetical protein
MLRYVIFLVLYSVYGTTASRSRGILVNMLPFGVRNDTCRAV